MRRPLHKFLFMWVPYNLLSHFEILKTHLSLTDNVVTLLWIEVIKFQIIMIFVTFYIYIILKTFLYLCESVMISQR